MNDTTNNTTWTERATKAVMAALAAWEAQPEKEDYCDERLENLAYYLKERAAR